MTRKLMVRCQNPKALAVLALAACWGCSYTVVPDADGSSALPPVEGPSVLQHHKRPSRDGLYIDPALDRAAARRLHRDPGFHSAMIAGPVYAQPLYLENGPGGKDTLFVATEQNQVYALDAKSGALIWQRALGAPVPLDKLPCGNIDPLGVTGTPVIDPQSRTLFMDAMTTPDGGTTQRHMIFALGVDDGTVRPGWPVDVSARVKGFSSTYQNQRGALGLVGDMVYAPYGGHAGDCGFETYHGWVVGVQVSNPGVVKAWSTRHSAGGAWAPGGVAADRTSVYVATGNANSTDDMPWGGGEAIIRLGLGLSFSEQPADYFTPPDWRDLDIGDVDIGGSGPVLFDVPGATPSQLVVSLGKNGKVYLLDRNNLGGVNPGVAGKLVASTVIINAAAAYTTNAASYVVFRAPSPDCPAGQSGEVTALRIGATAPPTINVAWCGSQGGTGSPAVSTADGRSESVVWGIGAEGDGHLRGFDGDTGEVIFDSAMDEAMDGLSRFQTPIVVKGRIFVAADGQVYAFTSR